MQHEREELKQRFLAFQAFRTGRFKLSSGKESGYYVDAKAVLGHGPTVELIGRLVFLATQDLKIDAIGGVETAAVPIATAGVFAYVRDWPDHVDLPYRGVGLFWVRKESKKHGTGNRVEGRCRAGDEVVVVVDDVVTTGESTLKAVEAVEAAGAVVRRVVCLVDRLQGGAKLLAGYDFRPLLTVRDFGIEPDKE